MQFCIRKEMTMAPSRRLKKKAASSAATKAASKEKKSTLTCLSPDQLWLDAQESCDVKLSILPHHPLQENCPPPLVVFASSHMLSRIPYFATSLSEPWCEPSQSNTPPSIRDNEKQHGAASMRVLTLECASLTSPSDYRLCMQFSMQNKVAFSSIDKALSTLRCADHLLFSECMEACMAYLVTVPWSVNDYDVVRHGMSSLAGVKLSLDLAEKLAPIQGTDVYRNILRSCIECQGCMDFVMKTFRNAPQEIAQLLKPALVDTWVSISKDGSIANNIWLDFTKLLLLQGGLAKELQQAFVLASTASFCKAFQEIRSLVTVSLCKVYMQILTEFFSRFLTVPEEAPLAYISNAQRASVLLAWANVVEKADLPELSIAFNELVSTLPPHEPSLVKLVSRCYGQPFFKPSFEWWHMNFTARMKPPPPPSTNKGGANADE